MNVREPRFAEVVLRPNLRVKMRDGVELATDLYLPAENGRIVSKPVPALLIRTPYNKGGGNRGDAIRFARYGYVVAVQDVRGRFESGGTFTPFIQEDTDGYDTVEWLAVQEGCDGRVGTLGGSYCAWVQGALATLQPPHLAAMCHTFGYPHAYHSFRQGGALDVFYMSYLVMMAGDGKEALASPPIRQALHEMRFDEWVRRWPIREGQTPLSLAPSYERIFFEFLRRECLDEFWTRPGLSPAAHLEKWPDVPTLWLCGWFDHYPYAHPDTLVFSRLTAMGHRNQYVVFGPWTHGETDRRIGETTFGEHSCVAARFPDYELRWFDRWLKGIDDEGLFPARVQYFLMGGGSGSKTRDGLLDCGGEWHQSDFWPPREAVAKTWFLGSRDRLTVNPPAADNSSTSYRSDPDDPAPSSTGICYTVTRTREGGLRRVSTNGAWNQVEGVHLHGCAPPYLPLASRRDVIVFQTEPLEADLVVVGHPVVELWISSDAPDTDFVAKLVDAAPPSADYPAGFALGVSEGVLRAKFRNGFVKPELLVPGRIYLVRVELRPLAHRFVKGHRLRLDLTGSSWPHYDVNTHTGRNPSEDYDRRPAVDTIYHDAAHSSRLVLPVIEAAQ